MQTVHLKACDVEFAYLDSGDPETNGYTTLVCVHGHQYHAQTFTRLFPLAARHNLRIVALNRRDYLGSTPFSDAELAQLNSSDELVHRQFFFDRGLEIAHFLLWVIDELKIPTHCTTKPGGLALLGWSFGNFTTVAFLANLRNFPDEITRRLEPYLTRFFIYESVYNFLGFENPSGAYHPFWDSDIPMEEKSGAIDAWFTTYFTHPYYLKPIDERVREIDSLQLRASADPVKAPTSANRTLEEFVLTTDAIPPIRSELQFLTIIKASTIFEQFTTAITLKGGAEFLLPDVKVIVVDGTHTVWNIVWTGWEIQKKLVNWKDEGVDTRPVGFMTIEGSNHFVLWDDPELLIERLSSCLISS